MRVVFVVDNLLPGNGTSASALRTAAALRDRGHQVRFITLADPGPDVYPMKRLQFPPITQLANLHHFRLAWPDREQVAAALDGADVVHILVASPLGGFVKTAAASRGIAVTAGFHVQPENLTYNLGIPFARRLSHWVYRTLDFAFFHDVGHIHCPSPFIAEQLASHGYAAKLHAVSNGVPDYFTPPASFPPPWTPDSNRPFRVLNVSRLSAEKRQDVLIRAISRSRYRKQIQLQICGRGPHRASLFLHGAVLHRRPLIGHHSTPELIEIMQQADLYVHPADIEIESLSCLESIACGQVPVIADTPWSATSQFALDERSLFPRADATALAEKIDYWIDHPAELAQMRHRYRDHAQNFRLDRTAEALEQMFGEAITAR